MKKTKKLNMTWRKDMYLSITDLSEKSTISPRLVILFFYLVIPRNSVASSNTMVTVVLS